jgi:hypothetical protein
MLVAARPTRLLNTRHIVPASDAALERKPGDRWIV